jgi:plastocyanin
MRRALGLCAALAALAAAPSSALAAPASIIAGDANPLATEPNVFVPTTFAHEAGTVATLTWVAGGPHDADATTNGPDGQPLFRTELTRASIPVPGTQYLPQGSYPFICTIHSGMAATLNVNSGTPKPRPAVSLRLKSKSLEQVERSRRLRVRVAFDVAGGLIAGVPETARVEARLGKTTIADGEATSSRTLSMRVTKKGAKKLASRGKATVNLAAEVDFGAPAKGSGKLR